MLASCPCSTNCPQSITRIRHLARHSTCGKVVFINRFFFPDESATAQILTDLAVHLQQEGYTVSVVTARYTLDGRIDLPARDNKEGIEVWRVRSAHWGGRSIIGKIVQFATFYPAALVELLKAVGPDDLLVVKTDPPLICVAVWLTARFRRAHLINWLQDLYPEVAAELRAPMLPPLLVKLMRRMRNIALKGAVANVVIGEIMAAKLVGEGVHEESIRVVHNWADEQFLRPIPSTESALRKEWGFTPNDFVVGYSGNLGRAHEFATMLDAAFLLKERKDIKFLFVGGGHGVEQVEAGARKRQLSSVVFKPHQPRELLQDLLGAADVHWLSLRPQMEGLIVPSKFYGILAAGRPVLAVTASDGEIARLVRQQGCGYNIAPGNGAAFAKAVTELADDDELREEMGRNARRASERSFSKASALRSWSEIIRNGSEASRRHSVIRASAQSPAP